MNDSEDYRPLGRRRRLQIALLAVVTAVGIVLLLLHPPGGVKRVRKLPPDAARCADGQTTRCVGGAVSVIAAPGAGSADASAGPSAAGSAATR